MEVIISRVAEKLRAVYGNKYKIYTEERKQGIITPCFFVLEIKADYRRGLDNQFFRDAMYNILFIPSEKETGMFLETLTLDLTVLLEEIRDIRATKILASRTNENDISITAYYSMHIEKYREAELMETLKINEEVKQIGN